MTRMQIDIDDCSELTDDEYDIVLNMFARKAAKLGIDTSRFTEWEISVGIEEE